MNSTISAARAALYDLLVAADDLSGIQISFGPPAAHEKQEVVALLGVHDPDEEPAALGNNRSEETYLLEVGVKAYDPGAKTPQPVDARGFELADAVRGVVSDNRTLTNTVRSAWVTSQTTDGALPAENAGWVIYLRLLITCKARIT